MSYGLNLLNTGIFWDDWALWHHSYSTVLGLTHELGSPWLGHFIFFVLSIGNGTSVARLLTFLSYWIAALCLLGILRKLKSIDAISRVAITSVFAIFPINHSRILLCCTANAVAYSIFFIGFLLLSQDKWRSSIWVRMIVLTLFSCSFSTGSLLVFYGLPLAYLFHTQRPRFERTESLIGHHIDFLVLPFVFFAIKSVWFVPSGLYAGYNAVSAVNLITVPIGFLYTLKQYVFDVLSKGIGAVGNALVLGASFLFFLVLRQFKQSESSTASDVRFILLGLGAVLIGVLPYLMVGKSPDSILWNDRHALPLPLGAAFFAVYFFRLLGSKIRLSHEKTVMVYALLLAAFTIQNIQTALAFQRDSYKQVGLIERFKDNPTIRTNHTFQIDDRTQHIWAEGRRISYYEYTGMMRTAFGSDTRFAASLGDKEWHRTDFSACISHPQYSMSRWPNSPPEYCITIRQQGEIGYCAWGIRMAFLQFFNPPRYRQLAKDNFVISISTL